jgi:hypothetical protein
MPNLPLSDETANVIGRLHSYLKEEGRDIASFGLQAGIRLHAGGAADWVSAARRWQALGATHLGLGTAAPGLTLIQRLEAAITARRVLSEELN